MNGRPEKFASRVLQPGDRVRVDERRWEGFETKWDEQRILYEDGDLLVYDKPPGVVSEREALNGFYPAHRLDKETSGALLLAKNR
ncbi:MAG: hypothetical protein KDK65_07675, partial [Chlamydiia bacterium]|nr:hypothetical protein [Chlamydiia bacterium]